MSGRRPDDAQPGLAAVVAHELQRRTRRGLKRLIRPWWLGRLERANRTAGTPVAGGAGPVVSLTTFEPRWATVHFTIESIAAGTLRPARLVLWVSHALLAGGLPATLERLVRRGLEVRGTEDLGPHKKYYPLVAAEPRPAAFATADDDVLYPADWLASLVAAAAAAPQAIHAHRAHAMAFQPDGRFLRYEDWPACRSTRPSPLHFATGVGGVLYPAVMHEALRAAGDAFRGCAPRADDIWLNAIACRSGVPVAQTRVFSPQWFEVPGTRDHGLARGNVQQGGNDRQLEATYTADERRRLYALWRAAHDGRRGVRQEGRQA